MLAPCPGVREASAHLLNIDCPSILLPLFDPKASYSMRLLNSRTYQLKEFVAAEDIPRYAILSHLWGKDEVKFQDMTDPNFEQRLGYKKIKFCCNQAIKDGLDWVWADT